jgi:hypothetical protein
MADGGAVGEPGLDPVVSLRLADGSVARMPLALLLPKTSSMLVGAVVQAGPSRIHAARQHARASLYPA